MQIKTNRRNFLKTGGALAAGTLLGGFPMDVFAKGPDQILTVLHTNDVHSRIEPFPMDGGKYAGLGGAARRATLIEQIRQEGNQVLLLDAGDIFQGTPYFNYFQGELEFKLMNEMGYDAATIGNHDFDAGIEMLSKQLEIADFKMLNSNYDLSDTPIGNQVYEYSIVDKNEIRVGIFGLGIELEGLVPQSLFGNTRYLDPISIADTIAARLKFDYTCDLIICLSHLGYSYQTEKVSDVTIAENTRNIDLIIGGHTHTFLNEPQEYQNADQQKVLVAQVGWAGIYLGRLDYYFDRKKLKKSKPATPVIVG